MWYFFLWITNRSPFPFPAHLKNTCITNLRFLKRFFKSENHCIKWIRNKYSCSVLKREKNTTKGFKDLKKFGSTTLRYLLRKKQARRGVSMKNENSSFSFYTYICQKGNTTRKTYFRINFINQRRFKNETKKKCM